MYYLLTLSIYWLASWVFYRLFLERERFFHLNRIYLLLTFALAPILPLLPWEDLLPNPSWPDLPALLLQTVTISAEGTAVPAVVNSLHWTTLLKVFWGIGSAFVLYRFLAHLQQLLNLIRHGQQTPHAHYIQVEHPAVVAPYSWFHFLFWNKHETLNTGQAQAIIAHELAHIKQGHSWDLLFMELSKIIFWWNPLWYAYRYSLEAVHEYLADAEALARVSTSDYSRLLLQQHLLPQQPLIHTFHTSQFKKRIIMMTKSPSSTLALGKYLFFIPVFILLLLACEDQEAQQEITEQAKEQLQEPSLYEQIDTVFATDPTTGAESVAYLKTTIYEVAEQMPAFGNCAGYSGKDLAKCSNQNLITYIYEHVKYPEAAREADQEGLALISFIVDVSGKVTNVQPIAEKTTAHETLNEAALAVVNSLPAFTPGRQDGKPVNVKMVLPIKFKLD